MAPFIRIFLRYLAGILVGYGLLTQEDASAISFDPDLVGLLEIAIGFLIGFCSEAWYYIARKLGWKK